MRVVVVYDYNVYCFISFLVFFFNGIHISLTEIMRTVILWKIITTETRAFFTHSKSHTHTPNDRFFFNHNWSKKKRIGWLNSVGDGEIILYGTILRGHTGFRRVLLYVSNTNCLFIQCPFLTDSLRLYTVQVYVRKSLRLTRDDLLKIKLYTHLSHDHMRVF